MGELQFSGDIVVYLISIAVMWGGVLARLKSLEKKMDKHNGLVEKQMQDRADINNLIDDVDCIKKQFKLVPKGETK